MKEPYVEGVATHDDPESCAFIREDGGEALDRGTSGPGIRREIQSSGAPTPFPWSEGNTPYTAIARCVAAARGRRPRARSEPLCSRTGRSAGRSP